MWKCEDSPSHRWLTCYHEMSSNSSGQSSKLEWTIWGLVPSLSINSPHKLQKHVFLVCLPVLNMCVHCR